MAGGVEYFLARGNKYSTSTNPTNVLSSTKRLDNCASDKVGNHGSAIIAKEGSVFIIFILE